MDNININEASAKELLGYFQAKLDEEAWEAKKEGRLSWVEQELRCCILYCSSAQERLRDSVSVIFRLS